MIKIDDYTGLEETIKAVNNRNQSLTVIISRGGLGKTQLAQKLIPQHVYICGSTSPLKIYCTAYDSVDRILILDEAEQLLAAKNSQNMLRQLCDSNTDKRGRRVEYPNFASQLGDRENYFYTKSPILLLANGWNTKSEYDKALLTRARGIRFEPTKDELINYISSWAKDKKIIEFMKVLPVEKISARTYTNAVNDKKDGLDWKLNMTASILVPTKSRAELVKEYSAKEGISAQAARRHIPKTNI
jgi:hypothetical protein